LLIIQHITISVEGVQGHERSSDPPVHYTGGAKVKNDLYAHLHRSGIINNPMEELWLVYYENIYNKT